VVKTEELIVVVCAFPEAGEPFTTGLNFNKAARDNISFYCRIRLLQELFENIILKIFPLIYGDVSMVATVM